MTTRHLIRHAPDRQTSRLEGTATPADRRFRHVAQACGDDPRLWFGVLTNTAPDSLLCAFVRRNLYRLGYRVNHRRGAPRGRAFRP